MSDVINIRYPDDESVQKRIAETPHASLHARHVLALQAANKAINRKNGKIRRLLEDMELVESENVTLTRQVRKYERIMDVLETGNADIVKQLLIEHGLAKGAR